MARTKAQKYFLNIIGIIVFPFAYPTLWIIFAILDKPFTIKEYFDTKNRS